MIIAIASDHSGVILKKEIATYIHETFQYEVIDCGPKTADVSVDYPDYAAKVATHIQKQTADLGIVICGTGIGISIAANKHTGIRCALCHDCFSARVTREHNNSNMLAMGARVIGSDLAKDIVQHFLVASFEGDRHQKRIDKITVIEQAQLVIKP
ncbi:ribose 5-phosphate isomerase B/allose 6-phosphate isomerase [Erysipelotrichaceae bacterium]|nr:ribose 5-phosphate isomerase B/allose 6-phosphate isomerase [Erysipelotrichaceae bacterium]